jgi:hypothetical protein
MKVDVAVIEARREGSDGAARRLPAASSRPHINGTTHQ